ncbi:Endonuclease/Exonuclease/phosphatase family protein [Pirellula sp. SH-Sr6A]|uniref:endonuclease/exonuclease/phosphatase family protein n=1 Tax=Pirellula sp. SH-Sr6A TaxID=1632865 RepID=UPI00078C85A0|nr:endonuclease/exonuclease/phosphatase family protein [Pirellula sp. SH-Sr6A]AMV34686.1 Endonuclease/Exonuclease/phosphatase family protein [Pirellula sp. SH-Sr6A]
MRRSLFAFLSLFVSFVISWLPFGMLYGEAPPVRVMSFNLRYGTAKDGANHWDHRKELLIETIAQFDPDLLGTQETLAFQKEHVATQLPFLESFGVGRDDGSNEGEMAALFFRKDRFEKLDGGHFWLSPTPDQIGSKGWDAALPRIATWVKLRDRLSPESLPILFLNTHFDHRGDEARYESAKLIRAKVAKLGAGHRVVVTGDFNAGVKSKPHDALFHNTVDTAGDIKLFDTYTHSESPQPDSEEGTFCNFDVSNRKGARIDWIAVSQDWSIRTARIDRTHEEERTPSDHFPVTAILRPASSPRTFHAMTYNIHHGRGMDEKVDLLRIAKILRDADPDWVALQEVDQNVTRSGSVDQAAELARLTDMYVVFGKAIDLQGGAYGQALLSKHPWSDHRVQQLANLPGREQRIALIGTTSDGTRSIQVIGTHLDHAHEPLRIQQAEELAKISVPADGLGILAGDMNAVKESVPMQTILKAWSTPTYRSPIATIPSQDPKRQIDFVLVKGAKEGTEFLPRSVMTDASDHLPLVLEWPR